MASGWAAECRRWWERSRWGGWLQAWRIARLVAQWAQPCANLRRVDPRSVRLGAVQMQASAAYSVEDYVATVTRLAQRAAAEGAQLIVFPEHASLPLWGAAAAAKELWAWAAEPAAGTAAAPVESRRGRLRVAAMAIERTYLATFRALARRLGVYLHAGNAWLPGPGNTVRSVAHLFAPDGRVLVRGDKAQVNRDELAWGLEPGDEPAVADSLLGRIGLLSGDDAAYWEPFRIVYLKGADIAVVAAAESEAAAAHPARDPLWARLQESPMYGVRACLTGSLFGRRLAGRTGIFGPLELSRRGDGIWQQMADPAGEGVVVATVDLAELQEYRRRVGIDGAFNPFLYERYLPGLYEHPGRRASPGPRPPRRRRGRGRRRRRRTSEAPLPNAR